MLKLSNNRYPIFFVLLVCPLAARAADINLAEQLSEGGIALVIILLMSVLLVAVSAERIMNFRAKYVIPFRLITQIKPLWQEGKFQDAQRILESEKSTLGRILYFLVLQRHRQPDSLMTGASEIASLELRQHQQKAYALAIIATVAPIVGLLGTVIGMIEAFHVIAYSQGMGNPALLAGGISKALINTAAGLSVALPALAMHHFFKHRCASFGLQFEKIINQLVSEGFSDSQETSVFPDANKVAYAN